MEVLQLFANTVNYVRNHKDTETQRGRGWIALARAFLRDAPILVTDEPTTGLDNVTESELLETLKDLTRGKTTIMIAHRLSTIEIADRILVLHGRKVVQEGGHSDLILKPGPYPTLYQAQSVETRPA